nr:MAG TPA: hypothetical protein [Caudoviricetes sp.]
MTYKENLTSEEIAQRKAARKRFREIVKQRWQEETLKNLSKKALKKISKNGNLPLAPSKGGNPEPDLILLAKEVGGSLRVRFSQGVWYLHFTFFGKKVESAAANLTEAINGLIINKHLQNSQFTINK